METTIWTPADGATSSGINEIKQGLAMMGLSSDVVDWLMSSGLDVIGKVNEVRREVRLFGKGSAARDGGILSGKSHGNG